MAVVFLVGVALGLILILLMLLMGFTSRPMVGMADGYLCSDPHQAIGGWLFVFAVVIYGTSVRDKRNAFNRDMMRFPTTRQTQPGGIAHESTRLVLFRGCLLAGV